MAQVILMRARRNNSGNEATAPVSQPPVRVCGHDYSRGEIARGTGLSLSHVSRVFSSQRLPSVRTLQVLANYFGIQTDELLRELVAIQTAHLGKAVNPADCSGDREQAIA